ncbi:MAG: hypothetical protein E4G94_10200 [ANME-2 cluster archaeon]|nr:MAG: hypothetical protein E4G94_10200 [ANME-2 cluster archaeon]
MERDCSSACVAYSLKSEVTESAEELGMNNMKCIRLFLEITELMSTMNSLCMEDFVDENNF